MTAAARLRTFLQGLLLPAAVVALWQFAGQREWMPEGLLPKPSTILATWREWAFGNGGMGLNPYSGTWADTILFSARRVLQGFLTAVVIGVPLGVVIGWSRLTARMVDPMIQGLRPIPITAWLPFSIALFGIRDMGAVFLIALGAFYPDRRQRHPGRARHRLNLVRAARMMGAGNRLFSSAWCFRPPCRAVSRACASASASPGRR